MNKSQKKILEGTIILIIAAFFIVFQFKFLAPVIYSPNLIEFFKEAVQNAGFSFMWAFLFGIIVGAIICPFCALPLTVYVSSKEESKIAGFAAAILFNIGRMSIFILIGLFAGFLSKFVDILGIINYFYVLTGILMFLLSADLFGLIEIRKFTDKKARKITNKFFMLIKFKSNKNLNFKTIGIEYVLMGMFIGTACSIEFILPMIIVWTNAISHGGISNAIIIFTLFGIGTFIPPTILITMTHLSIKSISDKIKIEHYVRYSGAIFLLFIGFVYLYIGLYSDGTLGGTLFSNIIKR